MGLILNRCRINPWRETSVFCSHCIWKYYRINKHVQRDPLRWLQLLIFHFLSTNKTTSSHFNFQSFIIGVGGKVSRMLESLAERRVTCNPIKLYLKTHRDPQTIFTVIDFLLKATLWYTTFWRNRKKRFYIQIIFKGIAQHICEIRLFSFLERGEIIIIAVKCVGSMWMINSS